jgi:hypothetical protein
MDSPNNNSKKETKRPLSVQMINSLVAACIKQNKNIAFGPADIQGSFLSLVNRGLIKNESTTINGHLKQRWEVTQEAISLLKELGIEIPS